MTTEDKIEQLRKKGLHDETWITRPRNFPSPSSGRFWSRLYRQSWYYILLMCAHHSSFCLSSPKTGQRTPARDQLQHPESIREQPSWASARVKLLHGKIRPVDSLKRIKTLGKHCYFIIKYSLQGISNLINGGHNILDCSWKLITDNLYQ